MKEYTEDAKNPDWFVFYWKNEVKRNEENNGEWTNDIMKGCMWLHEEFIASNVKCVI